MCIECRRQAIKHLAAMIHAGRAADIPDLKPGTNVPESVQLVGEHIATILNLTLPTAEDDTAVYRNQGPAEEAALRGWINTIPTRQLHILARLLGYGQDAFDAAETISISVLHERAQAGDLTAAMARAQLSGQHAILVEFTAGDAGEKAMLPFKPKGEPGGGKLN